MNHIYFNGIELICVCIGVICGLFILAAYLLDRWCQNHWGSRGQKWIYKHILKLK